MIHRRTQTIRTLVEQATAEDRRSSSLIRKLQARAPYLHSAIRLPDDTAPLLLADFVKRYIEHVPDFIEAIDEIAEEAGIQAAVAPLLHIAVDYFLQPPALIRQDSPMEARLAQAYLAHRLLEEVNDRFISLCGAPLAPMDTTRANLVAHEIIGEPFANDLDQAVLFSAELLLSEHNFQGELFTRFMDEHRRNGWSVELSRWPCLAADRAIFLNFDA